MFAENYVNIILKIISFDGAPLVLEVVFRIETRGTANRKSEGLGISL
jgi:hypothetical protein